jgi:hypothetical protein
MCFAKKFGTKGKTRAMLNALMTCYSETLADTPSSDDAPPAVLLMLVK